MCEKNKCDRDIIGWARTAYITDRKKKPPLSTVSIYGRKSPIASLFMTPKQFPKNRFPRLAIDAACCTPDTREISSFCHSSCLRNFCKVDRYFLVRNFGCECRCGACYCSDQLQRAVCSSVCKVWLSVPGRH